MAEKRTRARTKTIIFQFNAIVLLLCSVGLPALFADDGGVEIGRSRQDRPLSVFRAGTGKETALVILGGIHGDEGNTTRLLEMLAGDLNKDSGALPSGLSCFFLPLINPDGNLKKTRANANNVDLNRNFPTSNWNTDAYSSNRLAPGSGGPFPASEPETRALMQWLNGRVKPEFGSVIVLSYHAAYPPNGMVQPGYSVYGIPDTRSTKIAGFIAKSTGYTYLPVWISDHPLTGELLNWCVVSGFRSADIELPDYSAPGSVPKKKKESAFDSNKRMFYALIRAIGDGSL
jgi:hypothetical protein